MGSHPRPRPATYDAGAGIDKNASLFLFDAMAIRFAELEGKVLCLVLLKVLPSVLT